MTWGTQSSEKNINDVLVRLARLETPDADKIVLGRSPAEPISHGRITRIMPSTLAHKRGLGRQNMCHRFDLNN